MTDYGIVLMTRMARRPEETHTAAALAREAHLSLATVSKVLRNLAREGFLESQRGTKGGYTLTRRPEEISVGGVIEALEGPIALTTCSENSHEACEHAPGCGVRSHWFHIDRAVRTALDGITLDQMAGPVAILNRNLPTESAAASHRQAAGEG